MLMVPADIDAQEIGSIAQLITSLNPELPDSLPVFHPDYKMADLPITSRKEAQKCLEAAREAGLRLVNAGNMHLLL
jgi:pyruvate formate lyase activating enzyme